MAVVCLHTTESLCFLKKIIGKDTTIRLFSLPLHADTHSLTPSWCFSSSKERLLRWGLGRVVVSWHNIERLLGALFLTDWNFANFMNSHEQCNGRCPRDVFSHIPLLVWLIASSDKSYIRIGKFVLYLNFLSLNPPKVCFFSRFGDFDDKILYLCTVYLTHINLTAVTLWSVAWLIKCKQILN